MGQQSRLIHCHVRVVDGLCKVHEYEQAYLCTCDAVVDAFDRFDHPIVSLTIRATGSSLFLVPSLKPQGLLC